MALSSYDEKILDKYVDDMVGAYRRPVTAEEKCELVHDAVETSFNPQPSKEDIDEYLKSKGWM